MVKGYGGPECADPPGSSTIKRMALVNMVGTSS
jgi:hypothetical protein